MTLYYPHQPRATEPKTDFYCVMCGHDIQRGETNLFVYVDTEQNHILDHRSVRREWRPRAVHLLPISTHCARKLGKGHWVMHLKPKAPE